MPKRGTTPAILEAQRKMERRLREEREARERCLREDRETIKLEEWRKETERRKAEDERKKDAFLKLEDERYQHARMSENVRHELAVRHAEALCEIDEKHYERRLHLIEKGFFPNGNGNGHGGAVSTGKPTKADRLGVDFGALVDAMLGRLPRRGKRKAGQVLKGRKAKSRKEGRERA